MKNNPLLIYLGILEEDLDENRFDENFDESEMLQKTIEFCQKNNILEVLV